MLEPKMIVETNKPNNGYTGYIRLYFGNVGHSEITQVGKLVTVIQTTVQVIQQVVLTKVYIIRPIS
jgi:hypothetical protein